MYKINLAEDSPPLPLFREMLAGFKKEIVPLWQDFPPSLSTMLKPGEGQEKGKKKSVFLVDNTEGNHYLCTSKR